MRNIIYEKHQGFENYGYLTSIVSRDFTGTTFFCKTRFETHQIIQLEQQIPLKTLFK